MDKKRDNKKPVPSFMKSNRVATGQACQGIQKVCTQKYVIGRNRQKENYDKRPKRGKDESRQKIKDLDGTGWIKEISRDCVEDNHKAIRMKYRALWLVWRCHCCVHA